ncbi:MAG: hypothetical protein MJ247_00130 [Alphaproteobacteria bacterium]|nr:hypothetical protein [Alphaproteobacteria bacterium]
MSDFTWRLKIAVLSKFEKASRKIKSALLKLPMFRRPSPKELLSYGNIKRWWFIFRLHFMPFMRSFSADLSSYSREAPYHKIKTFLLFLILSVIFYFASQPFYFIANDGFISLRYVYNAQQGFGYTFNRPPFEPVNGYTSFLWLNLIRLVALTKLDLVLSANILTFIFSMGTIFLGFCFLKSVKMFSELQNRSLYIFFLFCVMLLTNRTFLSFMWTGTETSLYNFLILWWIYRATKPKRSPFMLSVLSILIMICRPEGALFPIFTVILLIQGALRKKFKSFLSLIVFGFLSTYYSYLNNTYGTYLPLNFIAQYKENFPNFWLEYQLSFFIEHGYYLLIPLVLLWLFFKAATKSLKEILFPLELIIFLFAYLIHYGAFYGADPLQYRSISFLIPILTVFYLDIMTSCITYRMRHVVIMSSLSIYLGLVFPISSYINTKDLTAWSDNKFLYKTPNKIVKFISLFSGSWEKYQKDLISQGAALSLKEHQLFYEEWNKKLPSHKEGKKLTPYQMKPLVWDLVGQFSYSYPNAFVVDLSGQNNKIYAYSKFKDFPKSKRFLGHEKEALSGYQNCFYGLGFITREIIQGCEDFWAHQTNLKTIKSLKLRDIKNK